MAGNIEAAHESTNTTDIDSVLISEGENCIGNIPFSFNTEFTFKQFEKEVSKELLPFDRNGTNG
jgi:hypothetical protein